MWLTDGFADPELLSNYSAEAAIGGVAPSAYISEPTHFGIWDEIPVSDARLALFIALLMHKGSPAWQADHAVLVLE